MAVFLDETVAAEDPATLKASLDAAGVPTESWWGRANQFRLAAGREPGRGHVLLRFDVLMGLDATTDHNLTFSGADSGHAVPLTHVTLLRYECISPGSPTDGNAVYLVEVVDRRHLLAMIPVANGYKAYNVSGPDGTAYQTATKNGGSNWTWQTLAQDLATTLGIGTLTLPFTPDGTPENLIYRGSALAALDDVCARLACALRYDPTADTFAVVRLGVSVDVPLDDLEDSSLFAGRVWDGYSGEFARGWRPEKVRVRFARRPQPTAAGGESPYYTQDVTLTATPGVKAGTYVELDDDMSALGATGTPTNASALTARATERAADWLRKRGGTDRPLVRAWRDFQPGAIAAVGQSVTSVTFDDRGGEMRTWALAAADRAQEKWRPLGDYPPWWPFTLGGAAAVSAWKEPVRAATTVAGTLAGSFANGSSIDGIFLVTGDRILIKDQSSASENGIYVVNVSGAPTRSADADTGAEIYGATVHVSEGLANRDSVWECTTNGPITLGTFFITWKRIDGDVYGPSTATDNAIARFDTTSGKLIKNSAATVDNVGGITGFGLSVANDISKGDVGGKGYVILSNWPLGSSTYVGFNCNNYAGVFFDPGVNVRTILGAPNYGAMFAAGPDLRLSVFPPYSGLVWISDGTTLKPGKAGSISPGDAFIGGINVGGGTGSFGDLAAGNTTASDVEVTSSSAGLVLKSSNGTRFRVTVNNSGGLGTTSI